MKVISEYTIKKLIQTKLLENYKKKLLTENVDTASDDFKNQIISSGIVEALYLFLTENEFREHNELKDADGVQDVDRVLALLLDKTLRAKSKIEFENCLNAVIKKIITSYIEINEKNKIFTNFLPYADEILSELKNYFNLVVSFKAYNDKGDFATIANHTEDPNSIYSGTIIGVMRVSLKEKMLNILKTLISKNPINNKVCKDIIIQSKKLLPSVTLQISDENQNSNQQNGDKTKVEDKKNEVIEKVSQYNFNEIQEQLKLSEKQKKKLEKSVENLARRRTQNDGDKQKYEALLSSLITDAVDNSNNTTQTQAQIQQAVQNLPEKTQEQLVQDAELFTIQELKISEKIDFTKDDLFTFPASDFNVNQYKGKNDQLRRLTFMYLASKIVNPDTLNFENKSDTDIADFVNDLTLQNDSPILFKDYDGKYNLLKISDVVKKKAQEFFEIVKDYNFSEYEKSDADKKAKKPISINIDNSSEAYVMSEWLFEYFGNTKIINRKFFLGKNFRKFIKLKVLEYFKNEIATEALDSTIDTDVTIYDMNDDEIDNNIDGALSSQEQNNPKYTFVIPEANEISKTINDKKFNETKDNDYYIRLYNLSRILLDLGLLKNLKKKGFGFIYNTDTELDSFHRELITALTQIASDEDQNNSSNQPQPIDLYQCLKEFLGENSADSADDDIIAKSTVEINKEILITKVKKYIATNVDDNKEALDIKKTGADASQEEDTPIGEDFPIQYSADKIKSEDGSVVKILGLLSNEADDEGDSEFKKYQELDVGEQKTAIRNFYYIYLTKYLFETEANINPFGSEFIKIANELNFNEFGDLGAVKDEINAYIDLIKNVNNSDVFIVDMNKIENDFSNFYKCLQWVKEYFGNNKIFNKTLNLNNNFIKFIQLKLLDEVLADTTNDTLEKQKLRRKTEALLQRFIKNPSITDIETKQSN